jgi:hypothetical protein
MSDPFDTGRNVARHQRESNEATIGVDFFYKNCIEVVPEFAGYSTELQSHFQRFQEL